MSKKPPLFTLTSTPEKTKIMRAFNNDPELREQYIQRALIHEKAEDFLQDHGYYKNGKGNPSGCLTESNFNAPLYLERIGIPQPLTYLCDQIFEHLPLLKANVWPYQYITAMQCGVNLAPVTHYFLVWLLTQEVPKRFDTVKFPDLTSICTEVGKLHWRVLTQSEPVTKERWVEAVRKAADLTKTLSHAAAYYTAKDLERAARLSYAVNYSARIMDAPQSACRIITTLKNTGLTAEHMLEVLLKIIKGLDRDIYRKPAPAKDNRDLFNFLESLK